ncbi:RING-H2 finger protein ATL51-like [Gastrolobium bilobum]|uniref:RING-H2 finger protein ATL51-like n=1 Tax=Gastrolobium bilobum TaxID=150636 RepID=UPI002AB14315|nr:RING-H2 finger protein ATL51-like [Gastrolobium bilobum]
MDDKEAKHGSFVTPLVISAAGIICSTLAIAAYHFILLRYFLRPHRVQRRNNRNRIKKSGGVQEEILNKIPILSYSTLKNEVFPLDHNECSICLGELEDGELVRLLPACYHAFHIPCIDAWFKDHANCPVCRSPITCDCESAVPIVSQNGDQQRVSDVHAIIPSDHHHINVNDDVSASITRFQQPQPLLLRHSLSFSSSHVQKKPRALVMGLKRSLSLDQSSSYIAMTILRDQEMASTNSSTRHVVMSQYNFKSRSLRHLDHMSSVLMRSFSQFRKSGSGRSNGILPN